MGVPNNDEKGTKVVDNEYARKDVLPLSVNECRTKLVRVGILVGFDRLKRLFYPSRYQFQRILIHSSSLLRGLCRPIQWVRHTMDKRSESQLVYGVTSVEAFQLLRIEFMDVPSVA
eukprot:gb/GECG01015509.1/.p1 GENE.gb/GECG01015509.1/~~gb/GECG01015509.1/.p1  ORF type:complete len:116 (+),score=7.34 gb/GECG01015509.1/:1-348(+)